MSVGVDSWSQFSIYSPVYIIYAPLMCVERLDFVMGEEKDKKPQKEEVKKKKMMMMMDAERWSERKRKRLEVTRI